MTQRLYYHDGYLRAFSARVVESAGEGRRVYLDRTAFYPASGGQPFDLGMLGGVAIAEIVDEGERIAHLLEAPLAAAEVEGEIDWTRRYDHMQQHTGQHLLSAVLEELYGIPTVSFHLGAESSTIDVDAATLTATQMAAVEARCAEIVGQSRPVAVTFEDAAADLALRKASPREGTLRIVSIEGIDRSACGGTHVRTTAEIGPVLLGKLDKVRSTARIEFVCGTRALRRARSDFETLSAVGRALSAPVADAAALVAGLMDKNKVLEKERQRVAAELARHEGRALYDSTAPGEDGLRRATQTGPIDDATRARAQAFAAGSKAVFLAVSDQPPAVLLATSADAGIHAGDRLKAALAPHGGRGGGNAALAQGSVPDSASLPALVTSLRT